MSAAPEQPGSRDESAGAERRRFPRLRESCKIRVRRLDGLVPDDPGTDAVTVNISGGGLLYSSPDYFEPGTFLAVELTLPNFPSAVVALARAAYVAAAGPPFETGLEFWWVGWDDDEAQRQISEYIRGELAAGDDGDASS